MKRILLAAAACAALAACNTVGGPTPPDPQPVASGGLLQGQALLDAQKVEGGAEYAYQAAATAYLAAVSAGFSGDAKAKAKAALQAAAQGVKSARVLLAAGNADGLAAQIQTITTLANQVHALTGK